MPVDGGRTVESALLAIDVQNGIDDADFTIYAHAVDDAPNFANQQDVLGRVRTVTSSTVYALNLPGNYYDIDVTAVVQEMFNRPGWNSGQALAFLLIPSDDPALHLLNFGSAEGGDPARLTIVHNDNQQATPTPTPLPTSTPTPTPTPGPTSTPTPTPSPTSTPTPTPTVTPTYDPVAPWTPTPYARPSGANSDAYAHA